LGLALVVAVGAYRLGALRKDGARGAVVLGALIFGLGGWLSTVLLLLFFLSSSVLSRTGGQRKQAVAEAFAKGSARDLGQVLANGGVASVGATLYGLTGAPLWLAVVAGALAAATADTWSTELGVLAHRWPRRITDGKPVPPGTSGAISLEGTAAAMAGGGLVAMVAGMWIADLRLTLAALLGGFLGAMVDSYLGASVQSMYYCPACEKVTERHPRHRCGARTTFARGWRWLGNDWVNFLATLVGGVAAVLVWKLML
jgi:uncharacterized protein (TIGR00297 family)